MPDSVHTVGLPPLPTKAHPTDYEIVQSLKDHRRELRACKVTLGSYVN